MKQSIKDAWLALLTPEWWANRAVNQERNHLNQYCAHGLLWQIPEAKEDGLKYDDDAYPMDFRVAVASANDRGTYEELQDAVHAIPVQ